MKKKVYSKGKMFDIIYFCNVCVEKVFFLCTASCNDEIMININSSPYSGLNPLTEQLQTTLQIKTHLFTFINANALLLAPPQL